MCAWRQRMEGCVMIQARVNLRAGLYLDVKHWASGQSYKADSLPAPLLSLHTPHNCIVGPPLPLQYLSAIHKTVFTQTSCLLSLLLKKLLAAQVFALLFLPSILWPLSRGIVLQECRNSHLLCTRSVLAQCYSPLFIVLEFRGSSREWLISESCELYVVCAAIQH